VPGFDEAVQFEATESGDCKLDFDSGREKLIVVSDGLRYGQVMAAPNFSAELRRFCEDYTGPRLQAVRHAADVFDFFVMLRLRLRLNREHAVLVNAVLAYFVVPDDLYPEGVMGPLGLVDDLYVAAYAYRILRRELKPEELNICWNGTESIDVVMDAVYRECRAEIGKEAKAVLNLAGLS